MIILHCSIAAAQEDFNGLLFNRPEGFIRLDSLPRLCLSKTVGKQYCQLFIYPVEQTADNARECFRKQWDFFARKPEQGVKDPEVMEVDSTDGWTYTFGAARGKYLGQMFALTLSSRTRPGYTYYVATIVSDQQFLQAAEQFTNTVVPSPALMATLKSGGAINTSLSNPTAQNFTGTLTTEFEDGWTSRYHGQYVSVSKGDIQAWIFPVNDSLDKINRAPEARFEDKYWRYAVDRFFQTRNIITRSRTMVGPGNDDIFEAEVRNRETGQESYVAMRVLCSSGRCQPVLAFAPTQAALYASVFANYNAFEQVLPYNHFSATPSALTGTWQSVSGGATGTYSIAGGFQGGNANIYFTDGFIFRPDGTYESRHNTSRNSNTKGFQENVSGTYTLQAGTLKLSNRRAEDPGEFECWLEASSNGLSLQMVNKKFTGQRFSLIKIAN
jgi:hypothetical protein